MIYDLNNHLFRPQSLVPPDLTTLYPEQAKNNLWSLVDALLGKV